MCLGSTRSAVLVLIAEAKQMKQLSDGIVIGYWVGDSAVYTTHESFK